MIRHTLFSLALLHSSHAETVLWKATGSTTVVGGSFADGGITVSEPVTLRMTYSDQATFNNDMIDIPRTSIVSTDTDHRIDLNLEISITIGARTWKGSIETGVAGSPYTFLIRTQNFSGVEFVEPIVASRDGGTFSEFPLDAGIGEDEINLSFNGDASRVFVGAGISANDFIASSIGSAEGFIQSDSSSNRLSFSIDPSTVEILNEADEQVPPIAPVVDLGISEDRAFLTWQSDLRFRYRIESSPLLDAETWTTVETKNGTGAVVAVDYALPVDSPFFYRVVAVQRPPAQ